MRLQMLFFPVSLLITLLVFGCDLGESPGPDPQNIKLEFHSGFGNVVDTFHGTLTKDLGQDGGVTVPFWFTTAEQETLLSILVNADFVSMPDTVIAIPGLYVDPNPGVELIRVESSQVHKTVVWFFPPTDNRIQNLSTKIRDLIESTPEFKQLPPMRGGYG